MKIGVVGGGIGGLTAALALLKRGFDVEVYEQAGELREVGAGIQISANGSRVLAALGVLEELKALACEATGKEIRLWNSGRAWKLFDLGAESVARYGFPYLTVYRPDLVEVLDRAVRRERGSITFGCRCIGVSDGEIHLENRNLRCDIVIGADGVHSRVREALFGQDDAKFTGIVAWRGTVPMARLPSHMRRNVGTNWVGPGGHVVHYPVRRGEAMNFVGVVERADWKLESWTALGDMADCARDYAGWNEDVHALIRGAPQLYKWALVGRAPMPRWTRGRATLLGDACHPMLPFLAQGAVMAMEDGFVLARALSEVKGGQMKDIAAALERYESARRDRTRKAVLGSAENAKRFHDPRLGDAGGAQEYVDREWSEERVKQRYEWLFTYDATAVPLA